MKNLQTTIPQFAKVCNSNRMSLEKDWSNIQNRGSELLQLRKEYKLTDATWHLQIQTRRESYFLIAFKCFPYFTPCMDTQPAMKTKQEAIMIVIS